MARAARKRAVPATTQMTMQVEPRPAAERQPAPVAPPIPAAPVQRTVYRDTLGETHVREPFGGWLVKQHKGDNEWMAMLIGGAKADPRFPKNGDPDTVREHLGKQGADSDLFEALDDAERAWLRSSC